MEMNQNRLNRQNAENEQDAGKDALPSRADYHREKKVPDTAQNGNTKKKKVSIPLVLLLILLMLPVIILSIINNGDRSKANPANSSSGEEVSFETEDSVMEAGSKKEKETDNSAKKEEDDQEKIKKEEAEKEKAKREEAKREEAKREAAKKEKAKREAAEKEKARQEAAKEEAAKREAAKREAAKKEEQAKAAENPPKQQEEQNQDNNNENTQGNVTYHTVQQGENLFRIALKYYGSQAGVEKIRQANGLAGNEISVGQTLTIPLP